MKKGTLIKFKGSKVIRVIVSIDSASVCMDSIDEHGERKILNSNNWNDRKTMSKESFDLKVSENKILMV